ncbi:O-antigen ligase family protein [candidate division WOR-3 bacterium]|nr:O-antigen ligase family protein [candidate division WOR-3 bacterium]
MALIEKKEKKFEILLNSVVFFFLIILSVFNGSVHAFGPLTLEITSVALFGFYVYYYVNKNFVLYRSKYMLILGVLALWSLISAWLSDTPYGSAERWREWLAFFGLIFLANQFLKDKLKTGAFQIFLTVFGSAQAALGIIQFATGMTSRAAGTFGTYSNFYSHFLGACLIASVHLFFKNRNLRTKNELFVLFLPVFMISTALVLSGSRVVVFLLFPLAFMSRSWLKRTGIIMAGIGLVIAVLIVLKKFGGRDILGGDPYHMTRLLIWKQSIQLIAMKPFFGFGPGSFQFAALLKNFPQNFQIFRYGKCAEYAHNNFLETAVEAGIPAAIFLTLIIIRAAKSSFRTPLKENKTEYSTYIVFWFLLVCAFDTVFYPPLGEYLGAIMIGISLPRKEIKLAGKSGLKIKRWTVAILTLYVLWVLGAFVSELVYTKIVRDIESGNTDRVISAQVALSAVSYIDPLNPDIDYLKSYIYEYYWIRSKNTLWLQKAFKHSLRSSMLERDYRRWKRTLVISEKAGDFDQSYFVSGELAKLEPNNAFNLLNLARYEKDGFKKVELIKKAFELEPRSIAVFEMAYRLNIVGDDAAVLWNLDSLLSHSSNIQDTYFVSDFRYAVPVAQRLFDRGYKESAESFVKRIIPLYFESEDFILAYASFLAGNKLGESLTEYFRQIEAIELSPGAEDSLRRLRLVVQ